MRLTLPAACVMLGSDPEAGDMTGGKEPTEHGFATRAIRASNADNCSAPPIHMGATNSGEYTRDNNPTISLFEEAMAEIEGGDRAMAAACGMSAITQALLCLLEKGARAVVHRCIYVSTEWFFWDEMSRFGVETVDVDLRDLAALENALETPTRVVYFEPLANPSLEVIDIKAVAERAHAAGAVVVVDNTFVSPYLCRPLELGADAVVHSATKYLSGHGDALGGVVVAGDDMIERVRWMKEIYGGVMSPFNAFLILRGLETLEFRMERHCANAMKVAEFLARDFRVATVHYPGLPDDPGHETALKQMKMFGGIVGFTLVSGREGAGSFIDGLSVCRPWVSVGDAQSLAISTAEDHPRTGVPGGFIRASVGLEDPDDIMADFDRALGK